CTCALFCFSRIWRPPRSLLFPYTTLFRSCLISLGSEQTISKIMQLIKGESAFWFNKQNFITEKLEWQDEYFAVSVSESVVDKVRNYIKNQEIHHTKKSFQEEYTELIEKFGFKKFKDTTN